MGNIENWITCAEVMQERRKALLGEDSDSLDFSNEKLSHLVECLMGMTGNSYTDERDYVVYKITHSDGECMEHKSLSPTIIRLASGRFYFKEHMEVFLDLYRKK